MEIVKYLKDNLLIITSNNAKEKIIKRLSIEKVINYKILTIDELKKALLFSYDEKAILYIVNNYNVKPEIANEYLNAMYFIENKKYNSNKLNELLKIKQELESKNLLTKNMLFLNVIKNMDVIVYGIDTLTKEDVLLLNKLSKKYTYIQDKVSERMHHVYKFETIKQELKYLLDEISKLLNNNIPANKIKIANVDSSYEFLLTKYFSMYNLHISSLSSNKLIDLPIVKDFLNKLQKSNDFELEVNNFVENSNDEKINNLFINSINPFVECKDYLSTLKYKLKNTSIPCKHYENEIEIIDLNDYIFDEDEYVFVLSINQGILPKIYKNEEFLDNNEKIELGLDTSNDKNIYAKSNFDLLLKKNANLFLSYKLKDSFRSYEKSFALNVPLVTEKEYKFSEDISFSQRQNILELASIYDYLYLPIDNNYISKLNNTYEIPYKKYDNQFVKFDSEKIKNFLIKNKISLSYSSLDNYYKCGFRYYLTNILKLSTFKTSPEIKIGDVFHKTLEHCDDADFDFDNVYDNELLNITEKDTIFYAKKLKETLRNIIKINKENQKYTMLTNSLKEKKIFVEYTKPFNIIFKGYIDKIMYTIEDDKTYVAIIDFKTGDPEITVDKIEFGLNMQLPMYLYLLKHTDEFKNVIIAGFYLQRLLIDTNKSKEDPYESLEESIKYQGYTNSSLSVMSKFDLTYENSKLVKSLKFTKDGKLYRYSKVLTSEQMDDIANEVENKIKEAIEKIYNGEFFINPKFLDGENVSCKFCEFNNCCFMNYNNLVYLKSNKKEKQ